MRTVSFVEHLEFEINGNVFSKAVALGDVDNDQVEYVNIFTAFRVSVLSQVHRGGDGIQAGGRDAGGGGCRVSKDLAEMFRLWLWCFGLDHSENIISSVSFTTKEKRRTFTAKKTENTFEIQTREKTVTLLTRNSPSRQG